MSTITRRRLIAVFMLFFALPSHAAEPSETCHAQVPCAVGDRSYHILEPDGWDGKTPLPVLFHFHGWQISIDLCEMYELCSYWYM